MSDIILCNISDINETIAEARMDWINDVFDTLGIPDEVFEVSDIKDYRMNMEDLGIEIISYSNGDVNVYKKAWHENGDFSGWLPPKEEHLVAQWKMPERVMRLDIDRSMYYEIHLNEWSIKKPKS